MDGSPLGSSVHGILQVRILEWVATPASRGSSPFWDQTFISCSSSCRWVFLLLSHWWSLPTSWWSYRSTQFWHCLPPWRWDSIPQVKGSVLTRLPPPYFRHQSQLQVVTHTSGRLSVWSRVPVTPSLSLINLQKQLTELREILYLLDYWFILKGYNSETTRWKRCMGQGIGKGHRASMPPSGTPL